MKTVRMRMAPKRKQKGRKNQVKHKFQAISIVDPGTFFTTCDQIRQLVQSAYTHDWELVTCPGCIKRRWS